MYNLTKAAGCSLAETLHGQLRSRGLPVSASVLVPPGTINTGLFTAERNRQPEYQPEVPRPQGPSFTYEELLDRMNKAGNPRRPVQPAEVAAYVSSLSGGPAIPSAAQVNPAGADVALGQQLFITNCAQCHNFAGAGGALTYGKYAPPLTHSTPTQIYEAMLTGPEAMPVFSDTTVTPAQKRAIIAYVTTVRSEPNPGGFSLGRVGPVTEGLVAFLGGIAALVFAAIWITMKRREA